jgi:hypothetical protein
VEEATDSLAIQTLRNWTMAATFLASTAIFIGLAFLSFAVTVEPLSKFAHMTTLSFIMNPTNSADGTLE